MFLLLLILVSITTVLFFVHFREAQKNNLIKLVVISCFSFSWAAIVLWLTVLIEGWQISLNTPAAHSEAIPEWSRTILTLLQEAAYLLPMNRLTLAVVYAMPLLLIPLLLIVLKRSQATLILMFATMLNLIFFWIQVIIDNSFPASFMQTSIQGIILLVTYILVLYLLVRQRPLLYTT